MLTNTNTNLFSKKLGFRIIIIIYICTYIFSTTAKQTESYKKDNFAIKPLFGPPSNCCIVGASVLCPISAYTVSSARILA